MKNSLKITLWALLISTVLALAVIFSGVRAAGWRKLPAEVPQLAGITPGDNVPPGEKVDISFELVLPAGWQVKSAEFKCGKNAVAAAPVKVKQQRWRWSRILWTANTAMRPLCSGEIGEGTITLEFDTWWSGKIRQTVSVAVPTYSARLPQNEKAGSELLLADRITENGGRYTALLSHLSSFKYYYLAAVLLLTAVAVWLYRRLHRRAAARKMPVWEIALTALEELRHLVRRQLILPAGGYNRLTDILRDYLEIRFALPASRRTTPEFLAELSVSGSLLPEKFQGQLAEFLNTADLIRFAGVPSDLEHLDKALSRVEDFVKSTIPEDDTPENNGEEPL